MNRPSRSRACVSWPGAADAPAVQRLVLDTNVSLDLIVFRDRRWDRLRAALARGRCEASTRGDCRDEFVRVLAYPQFGLTPAQRAAALRSYDGMHRMAADPGPRMRDLCRALPQCRDPDDQKFMELALQVRAHALLSKDKALLRLARRNRRDGRFAILSPQAWLEGETGPGSDA